MKSKFSLALIIVTFFACLFLHNICFAQELNLKKVSLKELSFNRKYTAQHLSARGIQEIEKGNTQLALEYYEASLKICREIDYKAGVADNLRLISLAYSKLINYSKALEYLNEALIAYRTLPDAEGIATILSDIGQIYESLDEYKKALEYFNNAVIAFKELGLKDRVADHLELIGGIYALMDDYSNALEYFNNALKINKEIPRKLEIAGSLSGIGAVYVRLNQLDKALISLNEALQINRELDNKHGIADTLLQIAAICADLHNYNKAMDCYKEIPKIYTKINDKQGIALSLLHQGEFLFVNLGNYSEALECFQKSLKINQELKNKFAISSTIARMAWLYYLGFGNYNMALKCAKEVLALDRSTPMGISSINFLIASIYSKQNKLSLALYYYKAAINTLESIRGRLKLEEHKLSFIENKMGHYENIILLLLKLGKKDEAFDYAERAKSRALLDLLVNRIKPRYLKSQELTQEEIELNDKINALLKRIEKNSSWPVEQQSRAIINERSQELDKLRTRHQEVINNIKQENPEFASLISVEPLKSREVAGLLDKDTALLEYYVTANKLLIWIISNNELKVVELSVKEEELTAEVSALRTSIESRSDNYKEISRKLYKLLIEPAKPYINTRRLCIVPHKALHYLPFSALLNNNKFLIEDYYLFYSPNASLLKFCFNKRKININNLLAFGNPDNSLKNAEIEVSQIRNDFPNSEVFIKDAATETKAKILTNKYDIVHFACHGQLNTASPLYSYLKLAKDTQQDGRLETWEIYGMDLNNASLVTLSACKTALGNITNGDEIIGITRGFIYAGAPSIIATLWNIDDVSTSVLMKEFYSNLKNNHSKTESLRLAQLKLIEDSPKGIIKERGIKLVDGPASIDSSHPYYWAAFVLIGDWK